jgi:transcriptional regulator with XRE-family HTH domain
MPKPKNIVEELRNAVREAENRGTTRYRIAQNCDVSEAQLSRFMAGENVPKLDTAEKILDAIGRRFQIESEGGK